VDQESAAIKRLSEPELITCWKFKMSPTSYEAGKR